MNVFKSIIHKYRSSIQVKLLFCVWVTSSLATFIFTASQTYIEFQEDKKSSIEQIEIIKKSYAPSIGNSVWYLDKNLINSQLKGILNLKNISLVEIIEKDKRKYTLGKGKEGSHQESIDLIFNDTYVGSLTVHIDIDSILEAYIYKTFSIFMAQAFKAFLVSWIILFFFKKTISNHLVSANDQLKENQKLSSLKEVVLDRNKSNDELDELIRAFNHATKNVFVSNLEIKELNVNLEQKVADRTLYLQQTIEELRNAQERLIAQEKLASIGMLSAGIAHEIKNPINLINNSAMIIEETITNLIPIGPSQIVESKLIKELNSLKEMSGIIISSGNRANKVVSGMLMQSRTGKAELLETDLNSLIDEQLKLSFYSARITSSINCKLNLSFCKLDPIYIYPQDFSSTLTNIFDNAFYALFQKEKQNDDSFKPEIIVKTEILKNSVLITIRDNGIGIPKKIMSKITDPFFTTKPTGSGTGLGLSMAHDIVVQRHHGEFKILSEEGQFSEFRILIPINLSVLLNSDKSA